MALQRLQQCLARKPKFPGLGRLEGFLPWWNESRKVKWLPIESLPTILQVLELEVQAHRPAIASTPIGFLPAAAPSLTHPTSALVAGHQAPPPVLSTPISDSGSAVHQRDSHPVTLKEFLAYLQYAGASDKLREVLAQHSMSERDLESLLSKGTDHYQDIHEDELQQHSDDDTDSDHAHRRDDDDSSQQADSQFGTVDLAAYLRYAGAGDQTLPRQETVVLDYRT